jgi:hypothetical protein
MTFELKMKKSTFVKGKKIAWWAYAGAAVAAIATGPFSIPLLVYGGLITMALKPKEIKIKGFNWFDTDDVKETDDFFDSYFTWFSHTDPHKEAFDRFNSRYDSYENYQKSEQFKEWQTFVHDEINDEPFNILGVSANATPNDIKAAYRNKMKEYHPDLGPADQLHQRTKKTAILIEAYKQICESQVN